MAENAGTQSENEGGPRSGGEGAQGDSDRGGYLGFVAHEVRNPLSTALWTAELLARMAPEDRGGPRGEKLTAMCLRSLSRVRQLVEDHFLCERLDAGGIPVRPESLAVAELVASAVAKKPVDPARVLTEVQDGPATILVDRGLLERALEGVLAQAGRGEGPVRVESVQQGDRLELRVTGEPPLPNALADPKKGAPSDQKGRALALPAARRAMEALGGSLAVRDGSYVLTLRVTGASPQTP
ncbi:MAG TPA: histidine kinase dimerization/phospho-acceptor domain-containing protein [Anaeromyxobacteraceae bacterium]|nr:histidine kinase dimerization/phospho-acceptor domain-containing protein [Anaeromyxobacteraceae bacterium]